MSEVWKSVAGYDGYYEVSDQGNVRSLDRTVLRSDDREQFYGGKTLKLTKSGRYMRATLRHGSRSKAGYVHVLVAEAFLGPRPEGMLVLHKDDNGENNKLENLRYGSHMDNMIDRDTNARTARGSRMGNSVLSEEDVINIRKEYTPNVVTKRILAEKYNTTIRTIKNVVEYRCWTYLEQERVA